MKFVYGEIKLTERELQVACCKTEAAMRERDLARNLAAKKRVKEDSTVKVTNAVGLKLVHLEGMDLDAASLIRRNLHIAGRFYDHLAGSEDFFVEYLEDHYSVNIFRDNKKRRWHIKGVRDNVLPCYTAIWELIAEWRRRETAD